MPPLDPSILLGARGVQVPDPLETAKQGLSLADLSSQYQVRQYALRNAERKDQTAQVLSQLLPALQQGGWSEAAINSALSDPRVQANPDVGPELLTQVEARRKADIDAKKNLAAAAKDTVEARVKAFDQVSSTAFGESQQPDNLSLSRVNSLAQFHGLKLPEFSGDPNDIAQVTKYLRAVGNAAYAAKDQIANAETYRKNIATEGMQRENYASEKTRREAETEIGRGNLDVSRQRLAAEGKVIETDEDGNTWVIDKATGNARQVFTGGAAPGAPAAQATVGAPPVKQINFDRPMTPQEQAAFEADRGATAPGKPLVKGGKGLTEDQGKSTGFAMRMRDARRVIDQLEAEGSVDPTGQLVAHAGGGQGWGLGTPVNAAIGLMNPKAQIYEQAKRNWVTANLRPESGAVFGKDELNEEMRKWFPVPGESQESVDSKRAAREVAERALIIRSGPGGKKVPEPVAPVLDDKSAKGKAPAGKFSATTPSGVTVYFDSEAAMNAAKMKWAQIGGGSSGR